MKFTFLLRKNKIKGSMNGLVIYLSGTWIFKKGIWNGIYPIDIVLCPEESRNHN